MPNPNERADVLRAALRAHGRKSVAGLDVDAVGAACAGFTGSEIAALVPDALFAAFADGAREISTGDLLAAARMVVPLSKTAPEKIEKMREWAKGKARPASTPWIDDVASARVRALDL